MKNRPPFLPLLLFLAIMGWMVIVTGGAGIYHLTHGGLGSGPTEITMAILLALSTYSIVRESRVKEAGSRPRSLRSAGIRIIFLIALVLVAFSIYHLVTGGWVSAIAEGCLAVLLLVADYIALTGLQATKP